MELTTADIDHSLAYLLEIVPDTDDRLQRLYRGAIDDGGLLATDFYTLRDWLELTGYEKQHALHALIILLMIALDEGSLCLHLEEENCTRRFLEFLPADDARYWARRVVNDLKTHGFTRLIGTGDGMETPLIRADIEGRPMLFFQKMARQEKKLLTAFQERLQPDVVTPHGVPPEQIANILKEVLEQKALSTPTGPLRLDTDQLTALGLALLRPIVIVSGGPGTGKTSLVLSLLRCLTRCGIAPERIALAAPTGRAAQRLGDSLRAGVQKLSGDATGHDEAISQLAPRTLHQLLGYFPTTGQFRRHPESPIPADVVIVDEVSMVGLAMMRQLFHGLAPETRLILLGDKEQLPSVDAGAVLAHLLPEDFQQSFSPEVATTLRFWFPTLPLPIDAKGGQALRDSVGLLRVNHRSETRIQDAAGAVNRGETQIVADLPRFSMGDSDISRQAWSDLAKAGGCHLIPDTSGDVSALKNLLTHWAEHAFLDPAPSGKTYSDLVQACRLSSSDDYDETMLRQLRDVFSLMERCRLLTLVREGPWGCKEINRAMEEEMIGLLNPARYGKHAAGTPLLITHNDHVRKLYNGDVGLTLLDLEYRMRVVFPRSGGFLSFPVDSLPAHELGFALTVHKSQGSEYDQVLLVFPPEGANRLLSRELVYTAVTRARKLALLFGKEDVIRHAIERRIHRESGWLRLLHATPP